MILRRVEVALALNKTLMLKLHFQKPNIDLYFESGGQGGLQLWVAFKFGYVQLAY